MPSRAFDDREHRRGLVLGLTLAEVLLLLLFILLLALFWRLNTIRKDLRTTENRLELSEQRGANLELALGALKPLIAEIKSTGLKVESIEDLTSRLAELEVLRQKNSEMSAELASLEGLKTLAPVVGTNPVAIDAVKDVLAKAAKINPDDPPAVLRLALEVVQATGGRASMLVELKTIIDSVEKSRPGDTLSVIKEAIAFHSAMQAALADASLENLGATEIAALAIQASRAGGPGEHDWPPIISLKEADGYQFQTGSAELTHDFVALLQKDVVEQVKGMVKQYDVDVVEVIGHTDEQPIAPRLSNLDQQLVGVFRSGVDVTALVPADNAGLGMARAAAVAKVLLSDRTLAGLRILPLSGAQMIDNGDQLTVGKAGDVRERRRIEIRVRRSAQWTRARGR